MLKYVSSPVQVKDAYSDWLEYVCQVKSLK